MNTIKNVFKRFFHFFEPNVCNFGCIAQFDMCRNIAVAYKYFDNKVVNQFLLIVLVGGVALQKVGNKFEYVVLRELVSALAL